MTDKPEIPTDEPGQQPTPDADSTIELEGAGAIVGGALDLAKVAAGLASASVDSGRSLTDRYFTADKKDIDVGMDEMIRGALAMRFQSLSALGTVLDHVKGIAAINAETISHQRNSDGAFYGGLKKATSTHAAGLLDAFGLETDNEVLSTVALAKVVQALANEVAGIKQAIAAAGEA